jgi:hypothetical protein
MSERICLALKHFTNPKPTNFHEWSRRQTGAIRLNIFIKLQTQKVTPNRIASRRDHVRFLTQNARHLKLSSELMFQKGRYSHIVGQVHFSNIYEFVRK